LAAAFGLPAVTMLLAWYQPQGPAFTWLLVLISMLVTIIVAGFRITGYWRGCLMDSRYMISLSRFQMALWTTIVLSGFLMAVMINMKRGVSDPLAVAIPSQLWMLMGIATTSLIGSPMLLSTKTNKKGDPDQLDETRQERSRQVGVSPDDLDSAGLVVRNTRPVDARISDMFKGEEIGNAATLDLAKLQMFYFTIVLAVTYCVSLVRIFSEPSTAISEMPAVPESMLALFGISHTGYLAGKALPHSREEKDSDGNGGAPARPRKKVVKKKKSTTEGGNQ
jgi:hypothetical protein